MMLIQRKTYQMRMEGLLNTPLVKVITGIRRSGKSTLLKQLSEKVRTSNATTCIIFISFESLEFEHLKEYHALHDYIVREANGQPALVCIDEVQECPEWERTINSLLAAGVYDLWITGSNAHLLSYDLATYLAGRFITLQVFPLSFEEHMLFRGTAALAPEKEFLRYLKFGGFPGLHMIQDSEHENYLNSLYNTILLRDVVERHQIRDVSLLDRIIRFAFDSVGSFITARKISEYLKSQRIDIAPKTVITYLSHLESCFALMRIPRYDIKGKRLLEINEKWYLGDIGLRHGILGYHEKDIAGYLENIVALELIRRGYTLSVGKLDATEVDFIAQRGDEQRYFQVCYLLASQETRNREFGSLAAIKNNFPKTVLSCDPLQQPGEQGILWQGLTDFLLETDSH